MKLGFVSLPFVGHLNPMAALARKMRSRGHEIVFIGIPDIEATIRAAGLTFIPFAENEFPVGSLDHYLAPISRLHGLAAVQKTNLHLTPDLAKAAFEHLVWSKNSNGLRRHNLRFPLFSSNRFR